MLRIGKPSPLIPLNTRNTKVLVIRSFSHREHSKSHVVRLKNTGQLVNGHPRRDYHVSLHDLIPKLKFKKLSISMIRVLHTSLYLIGL